MGSIKRKEIPLLANQRAQHTADTMLEWVLRGKKASLPLIEND